jgi:hypothetical protein
LISIVELAYEIDKIFIKYFDEVIYKSNIEEYLIVAEEILNNLKK